MQHNLVLVRQVYSKGQKRIICFPVFKHISIRFIRNIHLNILFFSQQNACLRSMNIKTKHFHISFQTNNDYFANYSNTVGTLPFSVAFVKGHVFMTRGRGFSDDKTVVCAL